MLRALLSTRSSILLSAAVCRCAILSSAAGDARQDAVEPAGVAAHGKARRACRRFARLQPRLAVGRRHIDHGVADRRRLRHARRCGRRASGAVRGRDRAGGERVAGKRLGAALERRLPLQQRFELLLELLLIEQLPAGDAVDLRAQFGDAVLIGELHLGLAADQAGEHVVAEGEIGAGQDRPHRHDHQGSDHDPERHRPDAHLVAGMLQRIAAAAAAVVLVLDVARDVAGRMRARRRGPVVCSGLGW